MLFHRLSLTALALVITPSFAYAHPQPPAHVITVTGSASESRPPDSATVSATIASNNDSASVAMRMNADAYGALTARLRAIGVPPDAITTDGFNLSYQPRPATIPPNPPLYGYTVTREIAIAIDPIEAAGKVLDACAAAGAAWLSVQFSLRDHDAVFDRALAEATQNTREQASAIAAAAGLHIVGLRAAASGGGQNTRPGVMVMASSRTAGATEITNPAAIRVQAQVTATYDVR